MSISSLYKDGKITFEDLSNYTKNLAMQEALYTAQKWSTMKDPILIIGETGCGKNILAQAMHNASKQKGFYEVACVGVAESLFESEMFGYRKGAFTGATNDYAGLAKHAEGGTLFLDEIAELPLSLQVKLLRLIEQNRFYAVGSNNVVETDVRIICATNKSLEELRNPQIFRSDLFYRMPLCIRIPPLRERLEDLDTFISYFWNLYVPEKSELLMREDTLAYLKRYSWPGNIRELKFAIKGCVYFALGENEVCPKHLPIWITKNTDKGMSLKEVERAQILKVLDITRGNKEEAAFILGISSATLYRKLNEYKKHSIG
ncbi:sigma 54-interacting transcriptional regulator [Candidatus Uabimicrobium sp. HlEnr_7]|uniref:sigma 54-interacting transcriptional regulator n=1 Tax=Candidatus Uabimicrobium helgolandensis TaxID=3095367 RepID=UPI0035590108